MRSGVRSNENSNGFEFQILRSRVTIHSTIQIHGTVQNTRYYLNLKYEQCTSTHSGVAQAPKLFTI